MLIYLYGPDSYRRLERLHELLARYAIKHPRARLERFEMLDGETLLRFREFLGAQSLFGDEKAAIIYGLSDTGELPALLRAIPEGEGTIVFLSLSQKLPKAYALIERAARTTESFDELMGAEFLAFLKHEAARREVRLSGSDAQVLLRSYEGNAWGLVTELEKFSLGGTLKDPLALPAFFPLIQSLRHPELPRRMVALTALLEREESAAIFNVAVSIAAAAHKPAFADYDIAVKSGKLEYAEALTDMVLA